MKTEDGLFNFAPNPHKKLTKEINELIDAALEKKAAAEKPRDYLGGSRLGVECKRALAYEYFRVKPDAPKGGWLMRHARLGHMIEPENVELLRLAGFELLDVDPETGEQFEFSTAGGKIQGHCDGIITAGPVDLPYPLLFESKKMKSDKFTKLINNGLQKCDPVYWAQLHTYMAYKNLNYALFTAYCPNTCDIWFELVPYDSRVAQAATDAGVAVITASHPTDLPRVTRDPSDFRCRFCSWKETCWKEKN